ncbi:hypothetical protein GE09DRAFT_435825 [Coniochaeta sp. 2T2.1]|nr:hypothetical protein GE09DRAFT_435825 [Coniochaeta sp. 2T2.1]
MRDRGVAGMNGRCPEHSCHGRTAEERHSSDIVCCAEGNRHGSALRTLRNRTKQPHFSTVVLFPNSKRHQFVEGIRLGSRSQDKPTNRPLPYRRGSCPSYSVIERQRVFQSMSSLFAPDTATISQSKVHRPITGCTKLRALDQMSPLGRLDMPRDVMKVLARDTALDTQPSSPSRLHLGEASRPNHTQNELGMQLHARCSELQAESLKRVRTPWRGSTSV